MKDYNATIINDTYKKFYNRKANFKFDKIMMILVTGDIFENDILVKEPDCIRYLTPKEIRHKLDSCNDLNDLTKFYLAECDSKLKTYDPRDIQNNLKKINLL